MFFLFIDHVIAEVKVLRLGYINNMLRHLHLFESKTRKRLFNNRKFGSGSNENTRDGFFVIFEGIKNVIPFYTIRYTFICGYLHYTVLRLYKPRLNQPVNRLFAVIYGFKPGNRVAVRLCSMKDILVVFLGAGFSESVVELYNRLFKEEKQKRKNDKA